MLARVSSSPVVTTLPPSPVSFSHPPAASRQQRQATLTHVCDLMRARGASPHAIHSALHGFHAFLHSSSSLHPHLPVPIPGRFLSDIATRPIQWLWPQRIPLGKLTLLEGEPGIGTSLLALTITAVSSGQPLPDATSCQPGPVILISPQESASDTLKPRLQSAGADLSRVLLLNPIETLDASTVTLADRSFSLARDLDILEAAITRLAQLADRTACAIVLVRHLPPPRTAHALHPHSVDNGLPGLVACMAHILHLAHHPDHEQQLILLGAKHTLSSAPAALAFQITATPEDIPTLPCLGAAHFLQEPSLDLGHLSVGRQAILDVLETSLHPLTPIEIAHTTGHSHAAVRLLLTRMADSGDIAHPARGLYIAHQHRLASTSSPNTDTPATPETFDTITTTPATTATFDPPPTNPPS